MYSQFREITLKNFERYEKGEIMMLVAEANNFPVGQAYIDLVKRGEESIGVIWSLRVLENLQNLGIGTRLIKSAEKFLESKGFGIAEIAVEKDNPNAKRIYERLGYHVVRDEIDEWDYTTPEGKKVHVVSHEWIMHKPLD